MFVQAHLHLAVAVLLAHVVAEVVEAQGAVLGGDDTVGEVVWAAAIVEPPADFQIRGRAAVVGFVGRRRSQTWLVGCAGGGALVCGHAVFALLFVPLHECHCAVRAAGHGFEFSGFEHEPGLRRHDLVVWLAHGVVGPGHESFGARHGGVCPVFAMVALVFYGYAVGHGRPVGLAPLEFQTHGGMTWHLQPPTTA